MIAPLSSDRITNPHLRYLTAKINLQRISLYKVLVIIILMLQDDFLYFSNCLLDTNYWLHTIYVINHVPWFYVFHQVNATYKIIVIATISQHLLDVSHLYLIAASTQQAKNVKNLVMPLFIVGWWLDLVILVVQLIDK